jgi:hypothetical protein
MRPATSGSSSLVWLQQQLAHGASGTAPGLGGARRLFVPWSHALALCAALWLLHVPSVCLAEDEAPSIVGYGLEGMGTGAATGLALGYLATGSGFHSNEWRTLAWGTAIGALSGLGVGVLLGTVDAATGPARGVGFYMIRDSNYGFTVGFLAGGIIGALVWLGDGTGKDLLLGMAWGTVIGAGSGLLLGVLEGVLRGSSRSSNSAPPPTASRLRLGVGFAAGGGGAPIPYPSLSGRF